MRSSCAARAALVLAAAFPPAVRAQPPEPAPVDPVIVVEEAPAGEVDPDCCPPADADRAWWSAELYYLWWKPAPLPGAFDDPVAQSRDRMPLNLDGTVFRFDTRPGVRLAYGHWLDDELSIGIESGFHYNEEGITQLSVGGSMLAESPLIPYVLSKQELPEGQHGRFVAAPHARIGFQNQESVVRLAGTQGNLTARLASTEHLRLEALGGFRYLHLGEALYVNQVVTPADRMSGDPDVFGASDKLGVRTDFYGGQVGLRGRVEGENLFLEMAGRLGIGGVQDVVRFNRFTTPDSPADVQVNDADGAFALLPELTIRFGIRAESGANLFIGYNFLYLSEAVRLADYVGPAFASGPPPARRRGEFWAQGLLLGAEYRY